MAIFGSQCQISTSWKYIGCFLATCESIVNARAICFCFRIVVFGGRFTDSPDESTIDYALGVFLGLNVLGLISGIIGGSLGLSWVSQIL